MSLSGKFIKLKISGSSPVCLINDSVGDGLYHLRNSALDGGEALKKFNVGNTGLDFHVVNHEHWKRIQVILEAE